jgi:hypothetical protein
MLHPYLASLFTTNANEDSLMMLQYVNEERKATSGVNCGRVVETMEPTTLCFESGELKSPECALNLHNIQ